MKPLHLSNPSLLHTSKPEWWLAFNPLVGWWFAMEIQFSRIGRAIEDVDRQLRDRPQFPIDAWDGDRLQRAKEIGHVIQTTRGWANNYFLPSDPLELLLLEEEGMGYCDAESDIEEQCGLTFSDDEFFSAVVFSDVTNHQCLTTMNARWGLRPHLRSCFKRRPIGESTVE